MYKLAKGHRRDCSSNLQNLEKMHTESVQPAVHRALQSVDVNMPRCIRWLAINKTIPMPEDAAFTTIPQTLWLKGSITQFSRTHLAMGSIDTRECEHVHVNGWAVSVKPTMHPVA